MPSPKSWTALHLDGIVGPSPLGSDFGTPQSKCTSAKGSCKDSQRSVAGEMMDATGKSAVPSTASSDTSGPVVTALVLAPTMPPNEPICLDRVFALAAHLMATQCRVVIISFL